MGIVVELSFTAVCILYNVVLIDAAAVQYVLFGDCRRIIVKIVVLIKIFIFSVVYFGEENDVFLVLNFRLLFFAGYILQFS